jgi:putative alpha-1,2-mannosidase
VAGKFDRPFRKTVLWQDDALQKDAKSATGKHTGAWIEFDGNVAKEEKIGITGELTMQPVILRVGISFVSEDGARANLEKEIPGWRFDLVRQDARRTWSALLDRVAVEGGTPDQRKIFYTGVYHSFLSPNLFSDEDGQYIGFDDKVHSLAGTKQKAQYANFSDWDIYPTRCSGRRCLSRSGRAT